MRDRPIIVSGLAAFLVLVSFPVWYNVASGDTPQAPVLQRPTSARVCVAPREYMRASHMTLLAAWRDDVVRRGERTYLAFDGHRYEKNLTGTCLTCHANETKFCDRCHAYAGVSPACPDCHMASPGLKPGTHDRSSVGRGFSLAGNAP